MTEPSNTLHWRIHLRLLSNDEQTLSIQQFAEAHNDSIEFIDGHVLLSKDIPVTNERAALSLTTLQDAMRSFSFGMPGLYFDKESYRVSNWMPKLIIEGVPFLNDRGLFLPFGMIAHLIKNHDSRLSSLIELVALESGQLFLRPDSGNKPFAGSLITLCSNKPFNGSLIDPHTAEESLYALFGPHKPSANCLCFIASKRPIDLIEWRFWIVNRQVICHSPYSLDEVVAWMKAPDYVQQLAEQVADCQWQIDVAYVVDIATINDQAYVLEINAASTSGLYDAPIQPLFTALRNAALSDYMIFEGFR